MQSLSQIEGTFVDVDGRYVIVVGRFNHHVVDSLVEGAVDSLTRHGVDMENIHIVHVPGAWELPLAVKRVLNVMKPDAVIALGAVIRGGTPHFEYVAGGLQHGHQSSSVGVRYASSQRCTDRRVHRAGHRACRHQGG